MYLNHIRHSTFESVAEDVPETADVTNGYEKSDVDHIVNCGAVAIAKIVAPKNMLCKRKYLTSILENITTKRLEIKPFCCNKIVVLTWRA
ncbi:MAG: hypothetical protein J1G06_03635 [Oscillospiraceae bacterium]|nr:hypothetical protein [Oscillospiraceae bacterium]